MKQELGEQPWLLEIEAVFSVGLSSMPELKLVPLKLIWQEEKLSMVSMLVFELPNNLTSVTSQSWGYLVLSCRFDFIKNFTGRNICNRLESFSARLIHTLA
jgi:hypothetical protein